LDFDQLNLSNKDSKVKFGSNRNSISITPNLIRKPTNLFDNLESSPDKNKAVNSKRGSISNAKIVSMNTT